MRIRFIFVLHLLAIGDSSAFSSPRPSSTTAKSTIQQQPVGNILILDHLNINHEKGRHDWLKAFYFDFLKCAVDPRKEENLAAGRKTLWANIGANQFHLPEGKPDAQVLEGTVTLIYPDLSSIGERLDEIRSGVLAQSQFDAVFQQDASWKVTDPWGNRFHLVEGEKGDSRGQQPGGRSEGLALQELTFYTPIHCNMAGIARFYKRILGAPILEETSDHCIISVGPQQTLTFREHPEGKAIVQHEDLRDDKVVPPEGFSVYLSNYGAHVSMYVADLPECYQKAQELGITYVNPRFTRRAYTLEEAVDDCMFRVLEIKDPDAPEEGVILRLEHEIRSVVKRDGSMYKSCPFVEIPEQCRTP
jgi:hypothetical protein